MSVTPGIVTADAIGQLNKKLSQVVDTTILLQTRNRVRRDYAGEFRWSWAKVNLAITFTFDAPSGLYYWNFPADLDDRFRPLMSSIIGGREKPWTNSTYAGLFTPNAAVPRYHTDMKANKIWTTATGGYVEYQAQIADLPLDATQDSTVEPYPSGTAVTYLLIGRYWYAVERKTGKHQEFLDLYDAQLQADVIIDQQDQPVMPLQLPRPRRR